MLKRRLLAGLGMRACWPGVLALAMCLHAHGRPFSPPQVEKLARQSNLITVSEVVGTRVLGTAAAAGDPGQPGEHVATLFRVKEVVEGRPAADSIEVEYDRPPRWYDGPPYPDVPTGAQMLIFMHCDERTCQLTNQDAPGIVVARKSGRVPPPDAPDDVYLRVIRRIAAGLFADGSADTRHKGDAPMEIFLLDRERTTYVSTLFRAALGQASAHDVELRGELIAALVRRGDVSMLPALKDVLFSADDGERGSARQNLVLALQEVDWHVSLPVVAKVLQLPSADLRRVAAEAIQHLRMERYVPAPNEMSGPATRVLLTALHDPDEQVVFATMQSLGFVNGRLDMRPESPANKEQWKTCLSYWEKLRETD